MGMIILKISGYLVIMPDYYRGTLCNPATDMDKLPAFAKKQSDWKNLKNDWEQKIQPFAEKKGAQSYGTVGNMITKNITFMLD